MPTTGECVHLVIHSYFRSYNKDGSDAIRSVLAKNPMRVIESELLVMEFSQCGKQSCCWMQFYVVGIRIFSFFAPVTLANDLHIW